MQLTPGLGWMESKSLANITDDNWLMLAVQQHACMLVSCIVFSR